MGDIGNDSGDRIRWDKQSDSKGAAVYGMGVGR